VDYGVRQKLLTELDRRAESGDLVSLCAELLQGFQDGRIKLWTTMQALRFRRDRRELFQAGKYTPLHPSGAKRENLVAFARERNGQVAIVAVPRFSYELSGGGQRPPLADIWNGTEIPVPSRTAEFLENVFTGERVKVTPNRTLLCSEVFAHFPVALLSSV
jgi:(1->4)-alpha-D-glucan 1-alpha-D-glucosylmutase